MKRSRSGTGVSARAARATRRSERLPEMLRPLFWEYDFEKLRWPAHQDLVIAKVLDNGTWEDVQWLRRRISNDELREWIVSHRGRGLSAPQITFWQLILNIPRRTVNAWLQSEARRIWDKRVSR